MSNKVFCGLMGFGLFLLAGMIAPPLAINACLIPSSTTPGQLALTPGCNLAKRRMEAAFWLT